MASISRADYDDMFNSCRIKPFKVITSDDVAGQMNAVIVSVNEALNVSKQHKE